MEIFLPTYIEFERSSLPLAVLSLCTLLPVFAYASLLTLLVSHRSLRALSALAGLVVSHAFNSVLKRLLAHPRPVPHPSAIHPLDSHGMPSNHAQQAAFLAAYAAAQLLWAHPRRRAATRHERFAGLAACAAYATATAASRVLVRAHSLDQVAVGAVIGMATTVFWIGMERLVLQALATRGVLDSWAVKNVLRLKYTSVWDVRRGGCETNGAHTIALKSPNGLPTGLVSPQPYVTSRNKAE